MTGSILSVAKRSALSRIPTDDGCSATSYIAVILKKTTCQCVEVEMVSESIAGRLGTIFRKGVSGMPGVDDKGFTLVQVIIATFFFMVVALALISLNSSTWYNTHFSRSMTEGSVLAARHLEELIPRKYVSKNPDGTDDKIAPGDHSFATDDASYTGTYRIRDDNILANTKSVQITVTYETHGGTTRKTRYNYLIPLRK
jgi:hypothetical protein